MVTHLHRRSSSNATIKLLETDIIPPHASLQERSYTEGIIAQLIIHGTKGKEGTQTLVPLILEIVMLKSNSTLTVGRAPSSSVPLGHRTVSERHLMIYAIMAPPDPNPLVFCRDLGSTNGTYVNSRRLSRDEAVLLNDRDIIEIRHSATLTLIQPRIVTADARSFAGGNTYYENHIIRNRIVGEGGQAKVLFHSC
jgi:pSer/pThr/pTyr-binding forkhead associated (FHA) protein